MLSHGLTFLTTVGSRRRTGRHRKKNPVRKFVTTWQVPLDPPKKAAQLIYLFNAFGNGRGYRDCSTRLQWGTSPAGGGQDWEIASWYVGKHVYSTKLIKVSPGLILKGIMTLVGDVGSPKAYYRSEFEGFSGTVLNISDVNLPVATETLEVYNLTDCDQYPKARTKLMDIGVTLANAANFVTIPWTVHNEKRECGQSTKILSRAAGNGEVDILYHGK